MRNVSRILLLGLGAALHLAAPSAATGGWLPFDVEVSLQGGPTAFSDLADYTRFETGPDRPESRRFEYENASLWGLRLGIAPHPDLEFGWSRLWGSTRYRFYLDGTEVEESIVNGIEIKLGDVDLRYDLFSVRYRPTPWQVWKLKPVFSAGWGLVLQSQQSIFREPDRFFPSDYSDSDPGWELTGGVEGQFGRVRTGLQLQTFHWYYDTEDDTIPARTTHSWTLGAWLGFTI